MKKTELNYLIKCDKKQFYSYNLWKRMFFILTNNNKYITYKILKVFRKYNYYKQKNSRLGILLYGRIKNRIIERYNVELPINLGISLSIPHRNVIINENAKIGNNVTFHGFNVVGNNGKTTGAPVIEDNVDIGAGSVIIGEIYIAEGCIIGANSLVNKSCYEKRSILVANPAKKINKK